MSVTKSKEFRWLPGMKLEIAAGDHSARVTEQQQLSELIAPSGGVSAWTWAIDGLGQWVTTEGREPDLEDPATQGGIVFGIFAEMGIKVDCGVIPGGDWTARRYTVTGKGFHEFNVETLANEDSIPKLITAVFAALDSEGA